MKRTPYELSLEALVDGASGVYTFRTADGVHSKNAFRDAELLLLEELWESDVGRLLNPQANYGVVGTVLADAAQNHSANPGSQARRNAAEAVVMTESSARAAQLCRLNANANGVDARVSLLADPADVGREFDTVAYAPKPYTPLAVGKQRIAGSMEALRPGGTFYLSAASETGLERYERCLVELAESTERVRERNGWHIVRATRLPTVQSPEYVTPQWLYPTVDGVELSLATVPGLFAANELDNGTRLLLGAVDVADGERVLDACCGYGAVGAYAATIADCDVWLTDDDRMATACTECSLDAMGLEETVVTGDCVEGVADETFDRVLTNPPTHAGSGVLAELFAGIRDVLAPGGSVTLVHHRELDLRSHLDQFESVTTVRTGAEHVVVRAFR